MNVFKYERGKTVLELCDKALLAVSDLPGYSQQGHACLQATAIATGLQGLNDWFLDDTCMSGGGTAIWEIYPLSAFSESPPDGFGLEDYWNAWQSPPTGAPANEILRLKTGGHRPSLIGFTASSQGCLEQTYFECDTEHVPWKPMPRINIIGTINKGLSLKTKKLMNNTVKLGQVFVPRSFPKDTASTYKKYKIEF
jgi:hypothetical protein